MVSLLLSDKRVYINKAVDIIITGSIKLTTRAHCYTTVISTNRTECDKQQAIENYYKVLDWKVSTLQ